MPFCGLADDAGEGRRLGDANQKTRSRSRAKAGADQAEVEGDGAGMAVRGGLAIPSGTPPVSVLPAEEGADARSTLVDHRSVWDEPQHTSLPCRPLPPIPVLTCSRRERLVEGQ